jgi:hypothetical protein
LRACNVLGWADEIRSDGSLSKDEDGEADGEASNDLGVKHVASCDFGLVFDDSGGIGCDEKDLLMLGLFINKC